ncbi:MAG: hypothetical protein CFE31_02075 [Rhizobiales bacterium PAR1]|nr:MAG: hypothetical protein CFE31_02075 [Rhizobiales bacterium PAR1]
MLTQLVYTSRPRFDVSTPDGRLTLEEIASAARIFNSSKGITGVLLAGNNWLSQVLEGDSKELTPLLARILADRRHDCLVIVEMRRVTERRFGQWTMGIRTLPMAEIPIDRLGDITAEEISALTRIATD